MLSCSYMCFFRFRARFFFLPLYFLAGMDSNLKSILWNFLSDWLKQDTWTSPTELWFKETYSLALTVATCTLSQLAMLFCLTANINQRPLRPKTAGSFACSDLIHFGIWSHNSEGTGALNQHWGLPVTVSREKNLEHTSRSSPCWRPLLYKCGRSE